jgi:hypothetical protein
MSCPSGDFLSLAAVLRPFLTSHPGVFLKALSSTFPETSACCSDLFSSSSPPAC